MSEAPGEVAARALAIAKDRAKGLDAFVSVERAVSGNVRFARGEITTSGHGGDTTVTVWIGVGKRHAAASSNQTDAASLGALVERAVAMARLAPEDPERMPLVPPQSYAAAPSAWDDALARMTADDRARTAAGAIAVGTAAKVDVAGFLLQQSTERAIASTTGLSAAHRETAEELTVTARTPDGTGSGWAGRASFAWPGFDARDAERAVAKAKLSAGPRPLAPGKYTVVLEPAAVAEMLSFLVGEMDARSADEGRSFFAGKAGQELFAGGVSLVSDPFDAATPGAPFDGDGLALRKQTWIDDGRVGDLFVSRYWASKKGVRPTGSHSVFHLLPGKAGHDELVGTMKRGLLVTRFWYTRMLEPQTVTLTGLTRDGVFLVEDGKVVGPVNNFRYNESPVNVLRNVEAIARRSFRVPSEGGGAWYVPALRVRDFTMASVSAAV